MSLDMGMNLSKIDWLLISIPVFISVFATFAEFMTGNWKLAEFYKVEVSYAKQNLTSIFSWETYGKPVHQTSFQYLQHLQSKWVEIVKTDRLTDRQQQSNTVYREIFARVLFLPPLPSLSVGEFITGEFKQFRYISFRTGEFGQIQNWATLEYGLDCYLRIIE